MSHNNYNLGDDSEGTFSSQAHTFNLPPRINTASAQLGPASARGGDVLSDVSEDSGWSDLCKGSAATLYLSRTDGSEQARVVKKLMRVDPQYFENNGDGRDKRELLDNLREEFDAKFSSWSLLQDHRIASVFSVDSRTLTFHQDFYPRGDLRQFCQQGLSGTMCRGVFRDILAGVLYLHTQMPPIVHGCINPGKIYMTYDNRAKIGEFSLSQLAQNFSHLTPSVSVDWMLRWMSPEYVNNESIPTTQSDVWSLGCTFFEVITGCLPYHKHKSHVRILELLLSGVDPNLNEDIPTVISVIDLRTAQLAWQLIKKCWRPTEERPVAKQLLQELDSLLNNSRPLGPASLETKLVSAVEGPSLRGGCDKIISPRMVGQDMVLIPDHSID
ncbi:unnamed protein product [Rhizoctonia solani]|uniref:Protein kinase domain-containing protein n=1 Tax=Rhizoctonia solani TaxID=456999 RepID=A0A8H2X0B9_9AGAM|nr:unnamed protein product [Rhizoctonia solani]